MIKKIRGLLTSFGKKYVLNLQPSALSITVASEIMIPLNRLSLSLIIFLSIVRRSQFLSFRRYLQEVISPKERQLRHSLRFSKPCFLGYVDKIVCVDSQFEAIQMFVPIHFCETLQVRLIFSSILLVPESLDLNCSEVWTDDGATGMNNDVWDQWLPVRASFLSRPGSRCDCIQDRLPSPQKFLANMKRDSHQSSVRGSWL